MKAQSSIELLLLTLIALSIIAVGISALSHLAGTSQALSGKAIFLRESSFFSSLTKDICTSGSGNSREASFPHPFSVDYDDGQVKIFSKHGSMIYDLPCKVQGEVKGTITLKNSKGNIEIIT